MSGAFQEASNVGMRHCKASRKPWHRSKHSTELSLSSPTPTKNSLTPSQVFNSRRETAKDVVMGVTGEEAVVPINATATIETTMKAEEKRKKTEKLKCILFATNDIKDPSKILLRIGMQCSPPS
jgi:hypothetical protein